MAKLLINTVALLLIIHVTYAQTSQEDTKNISANEYMHRSSHESLARAFDSSERDSWQRPDTVISYLGDMTGKTIVDLGSGSGYFTFRLLATGAYVVAADVDSEFLAIIEQKRQQFDIDEKQLSMVHIQEEQLNIEKGSADIIFLVNVYHHINDRINYFLQANEVLKVGGKIIIIDFYKESLPVGPPKNHKISWDVVMQELKQAGYSNITLNTGLLKYQYLIEADRF
jgi:ubiquinone/menaquinone biosynthesis C-methylase UbiE